MCFAWHLERLGEQRRDTAVAGNCNQPSAARREPNRALGLKVSTPGSARNTAFWRALPRDSGTEPRRPLARWRAIRATAIRRSRERDSALSHGEEMPMPMPQRRFPVFVDTKLGRLRAGFSASPSEEPAVVALKLRDRGWLAYRIRFEAESEAWVAVVLNTQRAA
jgi:hypothetical protein